MHAAHAGGEKPRVLNLFGYTGAASLIAAKAGAEVTHVDASKPAIGWARENQAASGLDAAPIRWILDDARKFVAREVRRGRTYHAILLDPPKFGRGPEGEVWDLFVDLPPLLADCAQPAGARALAPDPDRLCHPRLGPEPRRPRARDAGASRRHADRRRTRACGGTAAAD